MDALKQWALCLIIGAAAGTFVMAVSPRGLMDKTVRAVVGIFVVAAMCSPLANLLKEDISTYAFAGFESAEYGSDDMNEYTLELFRNETEKIIISAAGEHGVNVKEIYINADIDTECCIIIHEIAIATEQTDEQKITSFSADISDELGMAITVNAE